MDIHRWLENTADREPPDQSDHLGFEHIFRPHVEPEQPSKKYRRKRKRASSDSSLLELRHVHHSAELANRAHSSDDIRNAGRRLLGQGSHNSERSAESNRRDVPSKTYEKRARHKTKPDRYESKTKKHHRERDPHEESGSKSKRRKSHRSGDGRRTTGLVQSFQLKNGPKNSRLTLKPETNAGLFKHGRASAQVAGRRAGLPDLVFNEMRFLQKPKDHQDGPSGEDAYVTAKKDSQRKREEEIFAYFARDEPSAIRAPNDNDQREVTSQVQRHRSRSSRRQLAVESPVDLPEKPFLGLGSKGQHAESRQMAPRSAYSWSESIAPDPRRGQKNRSSQDIRVHGSGPHHSQHQPRLAAGQENDAEEGRHSSAAEGGLSPVLLPKRGTWVRSRRATGPPVEVYEPEPLGEGTDGRKRRSVTKTTLQPLPHDMPSEPPVALRQRELSPRRSYRLDYHTSDILLVRQPTVTEADSEHRRHTYDAPDHRQGGGKENQTPRSSTPLGKLLWKVRQAVATPLSEPNAHPYAMRRPSKDALGVQDIPRRYGIGEIAQRQATAAGSHPTMRERWLESASGLHSRETRPELPRASARRSRDLLTSRDAPAPGAAAPFYDESKMLDRYETDPYASRHLYANAQQAEALAHAVPSDQGLGLYETHAEQMCSETALSQVQSGLLLVQTPSIHSTHEEFRSEQCIGATGGGDHELAAGGELAGFWKPNKLY